MPDPAPVTTATLPAKPSMNTPSLGGQRAFGVKPNRYRWSRLRGLAERLVDDLLLLDGVHLRRARRRSRHRATRDALDAGQLVRQLLGKRQAERRPGTLVGRLLLHPEELLGVGVLVERGPQPPLGQRVELLDADDRDVVAVVLRLPGGQVVVDLAAGEQDARDLRAVAVPVGERRLLHH